MKIFGRRSGRSNISRKYALKAARLVVACALLAGCNVFSMVGILDGSSSSSTSTTSGGSSTLQVLPTAANIVVNTTKEFAATGGSGGYTYTVDAGGVGGWMVGSVYHAPPLDTGTDSVTVTDSAGATSTATAMVVPPGTDPLTISPASATISVGGTITFTANGGSGTGYSYSINPPVGAGTIVPGTGLYTAPWSFATPVIRVTDSGANTADTVLITVNAPTAVQIAPSTAVVNAGGVTNFTASGGSGSYTYSVNPPVGAGTIVPGTGQYTAPWSSVTPVIHVIDNNTGGTADTVLVTVNAPPALQISPKVTTVFATGSVSFSASGGSGIPGNYSYSWVSGPGGLGSVVGAAYTPGIAGPPPGVIRVTDTATGQTDDATVTVDPVPVALTISPKTITINAGDILLMSAAGGVPLYTFAKVDGGGTFAGSTYTAPWSATTAHIRVTDSDTPPSTDIATITVNAPPALVISPSTTTLNVGQWVTFTGSGGSNILGNYSYTKTSGGGSFSPGTATYTAPGSATTATIRLRDNATGQTAIATVTVPAPPPLTFTPANSNVVVGNAVTFTPGGGSGSYTCSLVAGTGSLVPATYTYTTVAAETSTIRLLDTVTLNTLDATVHSFFTLTITPSTASVQINSTYPFAASGGVPPYTYSVSVGTGTIIPATGIFTAPGAAQSDTVKVTDSIGNTATSSVTVNPPGAWTITSIDASSHSGQYASLALDAAGQPRIAYYESSAKELRLATWTGSSWTHQTVDSSTSDIGKYASLALAAGTGYPRISYYDTHNHDLRYASWNGSSWVLQTVASTGDVGMYTSLALESGTGYPRISYYDNTNHNLMYAWWNGSSWSTRTVDVPGSTGLNTSLALQSGTNSPRISYYNTTPDDLKFAWSNDGGATWPAGQIKTIDSGGNVGMYTSLAMDPAGNPRISYYDVTNHNLKFAWSNDGGATWPPAQIKTVDSVGDVGMYTSLALDPSGNPRISYFDNTNKDLKYAWSGDGGATWPGGQIETVDSTSQVGSYTSLKLDPTTHLPRIAYYDSTSQDLKYAYR